MPFTTTKEEVLLASLLGLFACRAVFASVIVPPWQGPDEPVHFVLAQLLTMPDEGLKPARPALETQILESMGRYRWWESQSRQQPEPPPTTFDEVSAATRIWLGVGLSSQPLYYGLGAAALRLAHPVDLEGAYWRLRIMSIALAVATLVLAWAGTQLLLGPAVAMGATAIAALHPQFLLGAVSVNSDALAIFFGAVIWWLVARVVTGHRPAMSLLLIVVATAAALLTKRNAVPLVATAGLVTWGSFLTHATQWFNSSTAAHKAIALSLIVGLLGIAWVAFGGQVTELLVFWRTGLTFTRPFAEMTFHPMIEHLQVGIDSAWLVAGWFTFPAPEPWLWVARVLTVAGLTGAAVLWVRSPELRRPLSIAWIFVAVQAAAVFGLGFLTNSYPQGRYLFPVLAPATALLWLGLTAAVPAPFRRYAAPALVSILAVMDVIGFTTVLIPAYLPWG